MGRAAGSVKNGSVRRKSGAPRKRGMTTETTTILSPTDVLQAVKRFFMGEDAYHSAWLERESETHLSFGTFRGNIAVAAFPDPEQDGRTRVRVSTLREEHAVPRLMTYLRTLDAPQPMAGEPRA